MSVTHDTFVLERIYDASLERVFAAWSDPKAKAQWFVGPDDWEQSDYDLDFRVGGREHISGGAPGGPDYSYDATIQDIVPNERIIHSYEMQLDGKRISVSVATIEFSSAGDGTRLVLTEQGAYLDGLDDPRQREQGTSEFLDALKRHLER
ncbi:MAG TPA: SRPBCC family protein [Candidatus Limnocylindrales bacterium]